MDSKVELALILGFRCGSRKFVSSYTLVGPLHLNYIINLTFDNEFADPAILGGAIFDVYLASGVQYIRRLVLASIED